MELKVKKYEEDGKTYYKLNTNNIDAISVDEETYFKFRIYEKSEINRKELDELSSLSSVSKAKGVAIKLLARKMLTSEELLEKLLEKGYTLTASEAAIEEVAILGYINDSRYAQKFINERLKLKPKSKRLLRMELEIKGLSQDIIEEAINDADIDDFATAETLVRKRFGKYNLMDEAIVKKIKNFLLTRGYSFSMINEVINKVQGK